MPIDIRYIVNVYPSTLPPGAQGLELNGLLLTRNQDIPLGDDYKGMLQFPSAADVGDYFGVLSNEYDFATRYFTGTDITSRRPRRLFVAGYDDTARTAWLRSGTIVPLLSAFKEIAEGGFSATFSGVDVSITPVNLSTITSFSEAAQILQEAIRAAAPEGNDEIALATVEYSSSFTGFILRGGGTGEDGQLITGAAGNLAEAMKFTDESGVVRSEGSAGKAPAEIMDRIKRATQNWATFTSLWKATTEEKVAFGQWQTQYLNSFMYVPHDDDNNLLIPLNKDNDATILNELKIDCAFLYGGYIYAAFVMGIAASVNYAGQNTVLTYAHKAQTGLPYNVDDTVSARALEDKGVNFYGNYALRNDQFQFLFPGRTLGGWRWIDHFVNSIWFFSALETGAAYGLRYASRIPYNRVGASLIRSFYMDPINAATVNGTIDVGLELSEAQRALVAQEAGQDISGELSRNGYCLKIRIPGPEVRVNRDSTENKLWYTYAGSVHRLDLNAISIT